MFAEIFQRQENEVKECKLKTVNEVRASNFLAGGPRISSYASENYPSALFQISFLISKSWKYLDWTHLRWLEPLQC